MFQRLADRRADRLGQILALDHGDAGQHVLAAGRQYAGDDDVGTGGLMIAVGGVIRCGLRMGDRRNAENGKRAAGEKLELHGLGSPEVDGATLF